MIPAQSIDHDVQCAIEGCEMVATAEKRKEEKERKDEKP